jgi:hypothetical protein
MFDIPKTIGFQSPERVLTIWFFDLNILFPFVFYNLVFLLKQVVQDRYILPDEK